LRCEEARRCAECQREDQDFCFHDVLCLLRFRRAHRLHRLDAVKSPVGAQKELPARDGGRGIKVGVVACQLVLGDEFEFGFCYQ
jgi:hypothetical protein